MLCFGHGGDPMIVRLSRNITWKTIANRLVMECCLKGRFYWPKKTKEPMLTKNFIICIILYIDINIDIMYSDVGFQVTSANTDFS